LFSPVSQLESGGSEDICESEYGMDARKFSLCRNSSGGQIHRTRGWIYIMEKIRNHSCHDAHWHVLSDCFWSVGRVGELPPENNASCTIGQVPIRLTKFTSYLLVCIRNLNFISFWYKIGYTYLLEIYLTATLLAFHDLSRCYKLLLF